MRKVRLSVAGAGLIGYRHIEEIQKNPGCELVSIVDPHPPQKIAGLGANAGLAATANVPVFASLNEMLGQDTPDGVILATPNQLHAEQALDAQLHRLAPLRVRLALKTQALEQRGVGVQRGIQAAGGLLKTSVWIGLKFTNVARQVQRWFTAEQ